MSDWGGVDPGGLWESHAKWWIDGFTDGADPEYVEQIVPLVVAELGGIPTVLDLGCGEGQIARALAAAGSRVVGIDPTWVNLTTASERGGGPTYASGEAAHLPVLSSSVDAVVACLVFEHIDALDEAVAEVSRVLRPGGVFALLINHPLLQTPDSGWVDDHVVDPPEQYWRIGAYLVEAASIEEVSKDVFIRFVHRPLSRYVNCLARNGLTIEQMLEPSPPESFLARAAEYRLAHTVPRLMYLRCRK